ncbi:MAG: hypothetical protein RSF86_13990, partial [Angelakisella sp.]
MRIKLVLALVLSFALTLNGPCAFAGESALANEQGGSVKSSLSIDASAGDSVKDDTSPDMPSVLPPAPSSENEEGQTDKTDADKDLPPASEDQAGLISQTPPTSVPPEKPSEETP